MQNVGMPREHRAIETLRRTLIEEGLIVNQIGANSRERVTTGRAMCSCPGSSMPTRTRP